MVEPLTAKSGKLTAPSFPGRIPSIDGLRAISVLLVVFGHACSTYGAPLALDRRLFTSIGNVGVRFFFLISGFLITTLLLKETDANETINLRHFYIRRALRILPAFWFYLSVIYISSLCGWVDLNYHMVSQKSADSPYPELLRALTFTSNYQRDYNWFLNHLWSLSVEEQFYVLWPGLLCVLGIAKSLRFGISVLFVVPLIRAGMYLFQHIPLIMLSREFQAVADALATGCVLSLLYNRLFTNRRLVKLVSGFEGFIIGGAALFLGYALALISPPLAYILGQTVSNLGAALIIASSIHSPQNVIGRMLNSRALVGLGAFSYSLYLWQEPFMFFRSHTWPQSFPQNILLAFAMALLSYFLVERPFLRNKARWRADQP